MYFFIKFPRFIPVWLVAIVTQILIVGYELQVHKIGIKASATTGQPYYPYAPSSRFILLSAKNFTVYMNLLHIDWLVWQEVHSSLSSGPYSPTHCPTDRGFDKILGLHYIFLQTITALSTQRSMQDSTALKAI